MPRPRKAAPELYWLQQKQAYCVNVAGKRFVLGKDRDAAEMRRAELLLRHRAASAPSLEEALAVPAADRTVAEALVLYRRDLRPSMDERHVRRIDRAIGLVASRYGGMRAADLSPLHVGEVRKALAAEGQSRNYINAIVACFKACWRWCLGNGVVAGMNAVAILQVRAWEEGDGGRELPPRLPVADEVVAKTLPHLPTLVAALVRLLRVSGARPGEITAMRRRDVSTSAAEFVEPLPGWRATAQVAGGSAVWLFVPPKHKTRRKRKARVVALGPAAQAVLGPLLDGLGPDDHVFSPARSEAIRSAERRAERECPVYDSQEEYRRSRRPGHPRRPPGARYTPASLAKVIARACKAAGVEPWSAYQLRHRVGVLVSDEFDEAAAATLLGHEENSTATRTYTRTRLARLVEVAARVG